MSQFSGDVIGRASILLGVDASQLQSALVNARATVEKETKAAGDSAGKNLGDGFGAASGAANKFQQSMAGLAAGVGIVLSIARGAELAAAALRSWLAPADEAAQKFAEINRALMGMKPGEQAIGAITSQIGKLEEELAKIDNGEKSLFGRMADDFTNERGKIVEQLATLRRELGTQDALAQIAFAKRVGDESEKAASRVQMSRLSGIERVNAEEQEAIDDIERRERSINDLRVSDGLKRVQLDKLASERAATMDAAQDRRNKIREEEAKKASEDKARSEQDAARAMEQQTRETERRSQVESQARAQAQRDQAISNSLDRQSFQLERLIQAVEMQTRITQTLRRVT